MFAAPVHMDSGDEAELLSQGVMPWDSDADDVLDVLNGASNAAVYEHEHEHEHEPEHDHVSAAPDPSMPAKRPKLSDAGNAAIITEEHRKQYLEQGYFVVSSFL